MKRTKPSSPTISVMNGIDPTPKVSDTPANAILISDLHLTETTPMSRTDDYITAMGNKFDFIRELRRQNMLCPVLCAGDIFDKWKSSPWLCSWAFRYLPLGIITIPGQHDLPMHSLEQYDKSALSLLETTMQHYVKVLQGSSVSESGLYICGVPYGKLDRFNPEKFLQENPPDHKVRKVLLLHEMVWLKKPSWATNAYSTNEIINRFGEYFDLIVSGDNHISFWVKKDGCLLVNPGSLMRITADQADFKPQCFLYYASTNTVEAVPLPIQENVHTREHLDRVKERDNRIAAYVEKMKTDNLKLGWSFRENLGSFFAENDVPRKVKEIIWGHLEKTS